MRRGRPIGTLGVIGGLGPRATSDFYMHYTSLWRAAFEGTVPDLTIVNVPVTSDIERAFIVSGGDADYEVSVAMKAMLESAVSRLMALGCDMILLPCNTLQSRFSDILARDKDVESLSPIHAACQGASRRGWKTVCILGSANTHSSDQYQKASQGRGIKIVTPPENVIARIEAHVLSIVQGLPIGDADRRDMNTVLESILSETDGVILACTDMRVEDFDAEFRNRLISSNHELAVMAFELVSGQDVTPDVPKPFHNKAELTLSAQLFRQWCSRFIEKPDPELGRPGAVCPFVSPAITMRTVTYTEVYANRFSDLTSLLLKQFRAWRDYLADVEQSRVDLMSHIVLLPGLDDLWRDYGARLRQAREAIRSTLMEAGFTCGEFYPGSRDGSIHNPDFRVADSPVPAMVFRRLAAHDALFLRNRPEQMKLFQAHMEGKDE